MRQKKIFEEPYCLVVQFIDVLPVTSFSDVLVVFETFSTRQMLLLVYTVIFKIITF